MRKAAGAIINGNMLQAAQNIIEQVLNAVPDYRFRGEPSDDTYSSEQNDITGSLDQSNIYHRAEALASRWYSEPNVRRELANLLLRFELDESSIEAEAIRISLSDTQELERQIASYEKRRARALPLIEAFQRPNNALIEGSATELENSVPAKRRLLNGE